MRAALVRQLPADRLKIEDVPDPVPGPGTLLVQIDACGICGTDLHILAGESYRPTLPFVLGHEPAGTVIAAGSADAAALVGRRVVPTLFEGCGSCPLCLSGAERLCPSPRSITGVLGAWGGFAERMLIRAAQAVEIPAALSTTVAATLVDGGATAMNAAGIALERQAGLTLVVGGGPVGSLVAELLSEGGRPLVVIEPQPVRRSALERRGYAVLAALADAKDAPDVIVECSGGEGVVPWALQRLSPRGLLIAVGYRTVPAFEMAAVARKELTVRGVRSGTRTDLERILALVAKGRIQAPASTTWPLDGINDALGALRAGQVGGKAVIAVRQ